MWFHGNVTNFVAAWTGMQNNNDIEKDIVCLLLPDTFLSTFFCYLSLPYNSLPCKETEAWRVSITQKTVGWSWTGKAQGKETKSGCWKEGRWAGCWPREKQHQKEALSASCLWPGQCMWVILAPAGLWEECSRVISKRSEGRKLCIQVVLFPHWPPVPRMQSGT